MRMIEANGASIPALGLGTWQLRGEQAVRSVRRALDVGYRHIDTAAMYGNEAEVGEAVRSHSVPRSDIFLTTKVWPTDVAEGKLQRSAEASLRRLGVDRVDLLLIHWPSGSVKLEEQIGALCRAKRGGLTSHVGVANFPAPMLEAALGIADEPIVANQVEHHPYLDQQPLLALCRKHNVAMTSYTPLGRGALLDDPKIVEIARARTRTPAQVVLRWHLQQPMNGAIPKSANAQRIAENLDVFGFELTSEEMARISGLARSDGRMVDPPVPLQW